MSSTLSTFYTRSGYCDAPIAVALSVCPHLQRHENDDEDYKSDRKKGRDGDGDVGAGGTDDIELRYTLLLHSDDRNIYTARDAFLNIFPGRTP